MGRSPRTIEDIQPPFTTRPQTDHQLFLAVTIDVRSAQRDVIRLNLCLTYEPMGQSPKGVEKIGKKRMTPWSKSGILGSQVEVPYPLDRAIEKGTYRDIH